MMETNISKQPLDYADEIKKRRIRRADSVYKDWASFKAYHKIDISPSTEENLIALSLDCSLLPSEIYSAMIQSEAEHEQ